MKKNGFISIIILQIIGIIFIFGISIIYSKISILSIANSANKTLQSNYIGESNLNRLLYDKTYTKKYIYPYLIKECKEQFRAKINKIKLEEDIFENIKNNYIYLNFEERNNKKYAHIQIETIYQEISNTISFDGPIINNIFEIEVPYINYRDLKSKEAKNYEALMDSIDLEIEEYIENLPLRYTYIFTKDMSIKLNCLDENNLITNFNNKKLNKKHSVIFIENKENDNIELTIGKDSNIEESIELSGIIYIEGDLIIEQPFDFKGIIIIKDGDLIIDKDLNPNIQGIIIHKGNSIGLEQTNLNYDKKYIYYYGIDLPGFMIPELEVIKKY